MTAGNVFLDRAAALRRRLKDEKLTGALISSQENRRYFSGFSARDAQLGESSGSLLLTRRKNLLLTDSRYTEAAKAEAEGYTVITCRRGLAAELAASPSLRRAVIGYEAEFLTAAELRRLQEALPEAEFIPFSPDKFRQVKSPEEIRLIQKALSITEKALESLWARLEPGLTELEAARFLESEFYRFGAEGPSFATIIGSGPNGALPHAEVGRRRLKKGDLVIIDCGARYKGYAADITRTKILGPAKPWQREIYRVVREAQLLALAALGPGVPASEADRTAREHIAQAGYGEYFGHGLGHGVGLAVHEAPSLSPRNQKPLQAGEVVTVEPGIYLPGRGGVRLEQLALITRNGARALNRNNYFYDFPGLRPEPPVAPPGLRPGPPVAPQPVSRGKETADEAASPRKRRYRLTAAAR